tara:strand:- start:28312 stop:28707 length:396 start_codon:yes stop_codon:yes gene_type:complete
MYMSSNVNSVAYSSREGIYQVPESEMPYYIDNFEISFMENVSIHPVLLALTHSLIIGEDILNNNTEETRKTLTDDQFNQLKCIQELSNCCICMENKRSNIQLECNHTFCKNCIRKWLTEKSNTCPTCRNEV